MILGIDARNFGCFDNSSIHSVPVGPETVIFGPNNVGKSTMLAAYAVVARGGFEPPLTKFGSVQEASFGNNQESEVMVKVRGEDSSGPAERTVIARKFNAFETRQSGSAQSQASLNNWLQNTWYLLSERSFVSRSSGLAAGTPALDYLARNTIQFFLERWTARDPGWAIAEEWLRKIDPSTRILKSPLRGGVASIETTRSSHNEELDVNIALQGGGVQRALQIIAAVVFSPKGSVIIVEEPEMNLHKDSQQVLVDLFNKAVNEWGKQIIFTTHSWNMILPLISDAGVGASRGADHVILGKGKLKTVAFSLQNSELKIEDYGLGQKTFRQVQEDLKLIWG